MGAAVKLAFLSDIHANGLALEAVLNDLPAVDAIICSGDIVGYYPDVNEVCEMVRSRAMHVVRGNHDAYVCGGLTPAPEHRQAYRVDWTREHLDAVNFRWLASLPLELNFLFDGLQIKVRHASPWDEESYLYPDSPDLARIELEADQLLCLGHTHHPLLRQADLGWLLNPGSVGQPRDWNPAASYAIFDTITRMADFRRVAYDVAAFQQRLRGLGWEEPTIGILGRTRQQKAAPST